MPEHTGHGPAEHQRTPHAAHDSLALPPHLDTVPAGADLAAVPGLLPNDPRLAGRGNGPVRIALMQRMQHTHGNRALQRLMQGQPVVAVQRAAPVQRQVAVQRQVVVQRQEAGSDDCKKLITDKDWTVKGPRNAAGYDTGNYYKDVAAKIIAAAEQRGVAFDRALYLAAQARAEQGETDPKGTSYRKFNIQVTRKVVEETQGRYTSTPPDVIHTTKDGRKYKWLRTVEQGDACAKIHSPVEAD